MEALQLKTQVSHSQSESKRLLLPHMPIQFNTLESHYRQNVEDFIAERFAVHYKASISHFMPYLLSSKNNDQFSAAIGFQPANSGPLFLEQYLSSSIEEAISSQLSMYIERNKVVELGNLTSVHRGTSQLLFVLSTAILFEAGFEWTVFTATKQVQRLLARLDLPTMTLCEANPKRLKDGEQNWGSYYDDKPNVIFGNLLVAMNLLKQHPVTAFMINNYQSRISDIAAKISK